MKIMRLPLIDKLIKWSKETKEILLKHCLGFYDTKPNEDVREEAIPDEIIEKITKYMNEEAFYTPEIQTKLYELYNLLMNYDFDTTSIPYQLIQKHDEKSKKTLCYLFAYSLDEEQKIVQRDDMLSVSDFVFHVASSQTKKWKTAKLSKLYSYSVAKFRGLVFDERNKQYRIKKFGKAYF